MADNKVLAVAKKILTSPIAGRNSDPRFFNQLSIQPNPDPILRKMGYADETYDAIMSDAHVTGECRSIRGELIWNYRLKMPSAGRANKAALALVEDWFSRDPSKGMTWDDVFWTMAQAIFTGFSVHEIVWHQDGNAILPLNVFDRPNRRFVFNNENELRLLTKEQPTDGIEVPDYKFVISRHQPSAKNPYGKAVLSSCYWPYIFKNGGFKFFYQFCETYGLPFALGRYPVGTPISQQQDLLDALADMVDKRVATAPEGSSVELVETKSGSDKLVQQMLIELCNKEISKALTSQVLASDQTDTGSRAASETHQNRQEKVNTADRKIIERSINEIIRWITLFNFGDKAEPPIFEFFEEAIADENRAKVYEIASRLGARIDAQSFLDEFGIKRAENDDDRLIPTAINAAVGGQQFSHSCQNCGSNTFSQQLDQSLAETAVDAVDKSIEEDWLTPVYQSLISYEKAGKTLLQWQSDLPKLFSTLDDETITKITTQVLELAAAEGVDE